MYRAEWAAEVGRYDSVSVGVAREFRKRLELVTKRPTPALVPGAPLQFTAVPKLEVRGEDYGVKSWEPHSLTAYRSAAKYRRTRLAEGQEVELTLPTGTASTLDMVLVLDNRESPRWQRFHQIVAAEIIAASDAGYRVGLLQSDALLGPHGTARFAPALEALVQDGTAIRLDPEQEIDTRLLIVRHAGAAQGHSPSSLRLSAGRVIVVQDDAAGDARGKSIAAADVEDIVKGWCGTLDGWARALPVLPAPTVIAAAFDPTGLRLTIQSAVSQLIRGVRVTSGSETVDLDVVSGVSGVVAAARPDSVGPGAWEVLVDHAADDGRTVTRRAPVAADAIVWNQAGHIAVTSDQGLTILERTGDAGVDDLERHYLAAEAASVRVSGEQVDLIIETGAASYLTGVFAQREVEGGAIRRRDFTPSTSAGRRTWSRPLSKFADSRWRLYGAFRTNAGIVHYPIRFGAQVATEGTPTWAPQVLSGDRLLVAPPVPTKMQRAARRITAQARLVAPKRPMSATRGASDIQFDARHSQPRVTDRPTVSVVMPVYNVEPYLDVAISSVLDQEFRDLELILVDDASKDGGRRIIQKYWRKDPRVRVFALDHNTLGGAGIPSNVGLRAARGAYVAFADSDDHVTATGLAKMVETAETHEADLVVGDFRTFTDQLTEGTESYDRKVWGELPVGQVLSAVDHTALFRLSPVPWRKLYRRSFLEEHGIVYPEGDYFYEDNPLHWFVLSRARRVVLCDEVISFHRMEREGQTMSAQTYKLGAFVNHMNTVLNSLLGSDPAHREVLFASFANYLDRTLWVATKQTQVSAAAMIRRGFAEVYERAIEAAPTADIPEKTRTKLTSFRSAYPDLDLTIVVPVFNSSALLKPTIDSVLAIKGLRFDLLLVDDGSTDDSLSIMEDYEARFENVHVFSQGNRGAGRARNSVIPLASGRYTYFLDADDVIDSAAIVAAVRQADEESSDLLFMKYRIEYTDEGRSRGMFDADREVWSRASKAVSHRRRQQEATQLINYPWNRLIRTRVLHDANIFFGPTVVHNDVLFHWHSIAAASRISFFEGEVCVHRKFTSREQITNINDARRLAVLEALRGTHERISAMDSYDGVREEWNHFAQHLLSWAASRIPEELRPLYELRRSELSREFERQSSFAD
ncbi:glycosyltransferase family 2 protein [Microbacterium sp. MM2322]|uniref:glycosyltransferase family 2 protein n=1 Tax=Microbacterium sp. MM2322 TaxID=3157631 RepID=UPI0032D5ADE1